MEEATGGTLDSEIRTITVPDLTAPEAAISTPRVHRARTVREFQTIAADPGAVPAVAPRVLAHRASADSVRRLRERDSPTAVLLNRNGQKMADVPVAGTPGGHAPDRSEPGARLRPAST